MLCQLSYSRDRIVSSSVFRSLWRGEDSNLRRRSPADLQSAPFGRSGTSPVRAAAAKPSRWPESNRRPADYKSAALPTELHRRATRARVHRIYQSCEESSSIATGAAPIDRGEETPLPPLTKRRHVTSVLGAVKEKDRRSASLAAPRRTHELVERDSGRNRDVQGLDARGHRERDLEVRTSPHELAEPFPLTADDQRGRSIARQLVERPARPRGPRPTSPITLPISSLPSPEQVRRRGRSAARRGSPPRPPPPPG